MYKPKVGIFGLTGCAGDQLVILNCEDQLLDIASALDIQDFQMASSGNASKCELDIALVEGAVLSKRDESRLKSIRARSRSLIAIGTCAVWGGIAAMDRDIDRVEALKDIYGALGRQFDAVPARALHEIVKVDFNVNGCPIEKDEFLLAISSLLNGDLPLASEYPVCAECKMAENNCLLIEHGAVCLGPLTIAGCSARCPGMRIACVGCRGPASDANLESAKALFMEHGLSLADIARKFRTFAPLPVSVDGSRGDRS